MEPGRSPDLDMPTVRVCRTGGDAPDRAGHELVRLVADLLGLPPADVVLARGPSGRRVVLRPAGRVHVSVSHAPAVLAVAVSGRGPVGVDVERRRPLPAAGLARRWLSGADADWVDRWPPAVRDAAFLWLWTQKEAIGKARGAGLRGGMRQPVPLPDRWSPTGPMDLQPLPGDPDLAVAAGGRSGLLLAVACRDPAATGPVRVRWDVPAA